MSYTTLDSRRTREQWRDVLDGVMTGKGDVVVTRNQKPTAVIISYADYEMIAEQLDDIRSERIASTLYEQWKKGQIVGVPWSEAKQRLQELEDVSTDDPAASRESAGENS